MKILFITATRLGDAILSTGLLEYMRQTYPEGKVTVACGPLAKTIFEGFPNVETIFILKKRPRNGHWIDLWKAVVGTKWDLVVDLRNSAVSRLIFARRRYILDGSINRRAHKVEQAAAIMKLPTVPAPALHFTPAQKAFAESLVPEGGPVLAVGPSANWIGKTWAADRFIEVVTWATGPQGILPGARVAVFAAPGEEVQARTVLNAVPAERQIDGIAKGTPGEAAAAIARCAFYIGNDSGLMHAAAAAGVPTIGLFGPSWPHLYAPWGAHTAYAQTPESFAELTNFPGYNAKTLDRSLMDTLEIQSVIDIINSFWRDKNGVSQHIEKTGTAGYG